MITTAALTGFALSTMTLQGTEPIPAGDDKWTYLGLLLTTLIAPVIIGLIFNKALRPTSRPEVETTPTVSTDRGSTFSVEGMQPNMVEVLLSMWKKIDEMEETQEQWAEERDEFIRINEELRRHNRALAEGFDEVIDWIDGGALPPPPSVAQHVRDLVQRAIENGNYGGLTPSE